MQKLKRMDIIIEQLQNIKLKYDIDMSFYQELQIRYDDAILCMSNLQNTIKQQDTEIQKLKVYGLPISTLIYHQHY